MFKLRHRETLVEERILKLTRYESELCDRIYFYIMVCIKNQCHGSNVI